MRVLVRHFIYTAAAMFILQSYAEVFRFGEPGSQTKIFLIVSFAISLIVFFSKPLLKLVSFPAGGFVYTLLLVVVIGVTLYALESVIPDFAVQSFVLPPTEFFGIMLGGTLIEGLKALGFASAFIAVFFGLISWIMG